MKAQRWMLAVAVLAMAADAPNSGDFFIVSSVDLGKRQLLLKLPTEVTELMGVDSNTRYVDEQGKPIRLTDLRAGDTVYIASTRGGDKPLAVSIRKGPMTIEVLHQRYLGDKK
jgi:hypothetical protein